MVTRPARNLYLTGHSLTRPVEDFKSPHSAGSMSARESFQISDPTPARPMRLFKSQDRFGPRVFRFLDPARPGRYLTFCCSAWPSLHPPRRKMPWKIQPNDRLFGNLLPVFGVSSTTGNRASKPKDFNIQE